MSPDHGGARPEAARQAMDGGRRHAGRPPMVIGTAGWTIPTRYAPAFPAEGTHLGRYGSRLNGVEINSSFYRPHRFSTYERWAASVPSSFQFAVKLPKAITHEKKLAGCEDLLDRFLAEVRGLGSKLGVVLIQLPPGLAFATPVAERFLGALRDRTDCFAVCEPRNPSWFASEAEQLLRTWRVARVAADPAPTLGAGEPGGWDGLVYRRLHGSPRVYWSEYVPDALDAITAQLAASRAAGVPAWCIFDNTAAGHALGNALDLESRMASGHGEDGAATRQGGID